LGVFLIIVSGIISLSNIVITGAVVGNLGENYISIISVLIFLTGSFFILESGRFWNKYKVGLVIKEYESGELNPVQAALKINDKLFPSGIKISGVDYRGGRRETIRTEEEYIPINLQDEENAKNLTIAFYEIALINDRNNIRNCEIHLSRQASSKHHKAGLLKIIDKFEEKYREELVAARVA